MSVHLNGGDYCKACERLLDEGLPALRIWYRLVREEFPTVHISCVWRGEEEQARLVKHRISADVWPLSPHNRTRQGKPASTAMDLFELSDGIVRVDNGFMLRVANHLENQDAPIEWGGDSLEHPEPEHFEILLPLRLV